MDSKWSKFGEEIEVAAEDLIKRVKELIAEGNVHRIIIRNSKGDKLMEIPVTAGVAVGGAVTIVAPLLMALAALTALFVDFRVEVVRHSE